MSAAHRSRRLYFLVSFSTGLAQGVWGAALVVYFVTTASLSPLQLVLAGTALEVSAMVFQVPTGVFADLVSRRFSVVMGQCLVALSLLLQGVVPSFAAIVIAQVIWGLGFAFIDGALEAWVSSAVANVGVARLFVRGAQVEQWGNAAGIGLAVTLGSISIRLVVAAAAAVLVVAGSAVGLTSERERRPSGVVSSSPPFVALMREGLMVVGRRRLVRYLVAVAGFIGLSGEGFDRLRQAHLLRDLHADSAMHLSALHAVAAISVATAAVSIGLLHVAHRRLEAERAGTLAGQLTLTLAVEVVAIVVFGFAQGAVLGTAALLVAGMGRRVSAPLYIAWLTRQAPQDLRATVLSMSGQVDAAAQIVGGPVAGGIAQVTSLPLGIASAGLLLVPAVGLAMAGRRVTSYAGGSGAPPG